jgi:hypothetical protein
LLLLHYCIIVLYFIVIQLFNKKMIIAFGIWLIIRVYLLNYDYTYCITTTTVDNLHLVDFPSNSIIPTLQ